MLSKQAVGVLGFIVEAFASREGLPRRFRRIAAAMVTSAPTMSRLGDDRISEALRLASEAPSMWPALLDTEDGKAIRRCTLSCLLAAKRLYDRSYSEACHKWARKVRDYSRATEILRDSEGNVIGGESPWDDGPRLKNTLTERATCQLDSDNGTIKFPKFRWAAKLRKSQIADRSSRFPTYLTNHPQLFGYESLSLYGGMA
jgi:hypothetical protein